MKKMSSSSRSTPKQKGYLYLASSLRDGLEDNDLKQVTTLLKNKEADPNVLMPLHGITPFHLVIGNDSEVFAEEVTKLFLRHGGNPNVKSVDGMTPVHIAAAWGRVKILELLLANGGDPLCLDADSCSPFHYAFQGEHFEAISILSRYCINKDEEDEKPKFKRELDKVLVNNGEVLAEYVVPDEASFDSSYSISSFSNNDGKNIKINTSGYVPESNSITVQSEFVTVRKKSKKRFAEEKTDYVCNNLQQDKFDFKVETEEEEIDLINEIISQLSSSMTSDVEANNAAFLNYENERFDNCKTSSPKRMQITMTFNRPTKCSENSKQSEKQVANKRHSTLQVIKQHNYLPHLRNNKILSSDLKKSSTVSERNFLPKNFTQQSCTKKVDLNKVKPKTPVRENVLHKWLDETIISKSPNLNINSPSHEKKKKLLKTPIFEKKPSPMHSKLPKKLNPVTPTKIKSKSPNMLSSRCTPISQIPKPKKYFITPCSVKTIKRSIEAPTGTEIPNKRKVDSLKKINTNEKSKRTTSLNCTYSKSEASTPSLSANTGRSQKSANKTQSFKNIAVNLHNCMYNRDKDDGFKQNWNTSASNESKNSININEFMSGIAELASGTMCKSDFLVKNEEEKSAFQEMDVDLNRAILDSISKEEFAEENFKIENQNHKKLNKSNNAFDSLMCEKGSILSDSSDSFLSLTKNHSNSSIDNNTDSRYGADIKPSIFPESNVISLTDDASSSCKKFDTETLVSMEEEYKYEDPEEGVVFLERRLCVSPSCVTSDADTSFYSCSTAKSEPLPKEILILDNVTLRERLKNLGENPGPITKTTHHLYLKRLHKLESQGRKPIQSSRTKSQLKQTIDLDKEKDMLKPVLLSIEWIKNLDDFEALERKVFQEFATPSPSRRWREGTSKNSFNYLLLDPRITNDLPRRAQNLSLLEKWKIFLAAIFYVGKGKRSRPYAHLYDAFKIWVSQDHRKVNNDKTQRILDIWNDDKGVVVLHVFQNTIPVEAYTREAVMIEVLGTQKLGNCKSGEYYGVVSTMRLKEKCEIGRYLLFKALQILLLEGERQIFPENL